MIKLKIDRGIPIPNKWMKIDKGIPIPKKRRKLNPEGINLKHLFKSMKVGDSYLLPKWCQFQAHSRAAYLGITITTKKETDTHVRVWRRS
jgi:hypothetical protein